MSLEYKKPCQNEPENLQKIIIEYVLYDIKSMYPKKLITSTLNEHKKIVLYAYACEYRLDYRS